MVGESKCSQNTGEINSFDKVKTWIKGVFPFSKQFISTSTQDTSAVVNSPDETANRPFVFRSMSLPEAVSLRVDRPHFNNLQRICDSALNDMSFKRRGNALTQSFRRTNVLSRTHSAESAPGPLYRRYSIDESLEQIPKVEATVEYSSSTKKVSVITITLDENENGNDTTQVDVLTSSSASSSPKSGKGRTSVIKLSPQLEVRSVPRYNADIESFAEQNGSTFTSTTDEMNYRHCQEFLQKNIRETENAQATQSSLLRRSYSEKNTKTLIDFDEIQKKIKSSSAAIVTTSVQYFKTCQQLRVILKKAENIPIKKRNVFATVNLVSFGDIVDKRKGKTVKCNSEIEFNQAIYFEDVVAEVLHGMSLRIQLHAKRYPLSRPAEIGSCDIQLKEYDLTMDVTLLGTLRPKSAHKQLSSPPVKPDVQVISKDNSIYAQACSVSNVQPKSPMNMKRSFRINSSPAIAIYKVTDDDTTGPLTSSSLDSY